MGITQSILATAIEAVEAEGGSSINDIRVSIGELSDIVEDALQFAFEALREGTMASGATLSVTVIPARSLCASCDREFDHGRFDAQCPECGNPFVQPVTGRELRIDGIDYD